MSRKRRSYEAGHSPKFMVVIDDSPECDRALYFASRRALRIGATVLMLRVIETRDRNQQWLGVADIMRAEAREEANAVLDRHAARSSSITGVTPQRVIREGDKAQEVLNLIGDDEDYRRPGTRRRNQQKRTGTAGFQSRQERRRLSHPGRHSSRPPQR